MWFCIQRLAIPRCTVHVDSVSSGESDSRPTQPLTAAATTSTPSKTVPVVLPVTGTPSCFVASDCNNRGGAVRQRAVSVRPRCDSPKLVSDSVLASFIFYVVNYIHLRTGHEHTLGCDSTEILRVTSNESVFVLLCVDWHKGTILEG